VLRLLLLALLAGVLSGCAGTGGPRPGSPPHHLERGFRNLNPDYVRPGAGTRWWFFLRRALASTFAPKRADLAGVASDGRRLRDNRGEATVTWVGHATLLVQIDGLNVLTDPQWSPRASPVAFAGPRRVTPPGLRFEELPPIDVVLISHDHYDHLDVATVKRLAATHRPRFLVPLGLKAWFADLGIAEVEELDWWESRSRGGVVLTAVPAQHWSARTWWDTNRRLWSGWVVAGRDRRLYFAGDTGYWAPLFREIGRRLGPFDLAAVPIGAYLPPAMMRMSHTTPEEALDVSADVGAARMLGIHWGTFDLADEPMEEPAERLRAAGARRGLGPDRVWLFRPGETRPW
jgi:L-ascorbate metabolism protein UlaG (beta-lactamase superfamily)